MDFIAGIFIGYTIVKGLVNITVDDQGTRKSHTYHRGRLSSRDFDSFKGKKVDIEFETGFDHPKLVRISFPTSEITLG